MDWNGGLERWNAYMYWEAGQYYFAQAHYLRGWFQVFAHAHSHDANRNTSCLKLGSSCVCVCCVSTEIGMALEGSSRNNPIYLSDSSPISVPASPVKLLTEEKKRDKCRYEWAYLGIKECCKLLSFYFRRLVLELESSCDSSDDSQFEDSQSCCVAKTLW